MKDKTEVQLLIVLQILGVALGIYLIVASLIMEGLLIIIINLVGFMINIKTLKLINNATN